MREDSFFNWMIANGYDLSTSRARASNCVRISQIEGDLDTHFYKDACASLLQRLNYSTKEKEAGVPPKHAIPINGDTYTGTATLKQAVKLYMSFCKGDKRGGQSIHLGSSERKSPADSRKPAGEWPVWAIPGIDEMLYLARLSTKYYRFLSPAIVDALTNDNEKYRQRWSSALLDRDINPELYLWSNSPCAFPGIRRHAGSKEIASYRGHLKQNNLKPKQALRTDDNDFPKQIWSITFRGRPFSKFGPAGYALAHLVDHKEHNNRMKAELIFKDGYELTEPLYGLYTCPTNTIYVPENLIRPTDFIGGLRQLLFHKMYELYKDYCNILPTYIDLPRIDEKQWDISSFMWAEPVGTIENMKLFLDFRRDTINKLLEEG